MKMLIVFLVLLFSFSAFSQCSQNSECKSGRVCYNGACTDPSAIPVVSKPTPEVVKPAPVLIGQISVSSSPNQAQIFMDGRETGKLTPAVLDSVHVGLHDIMVFKDELAAKASVKVVPGSAAELDLPLLPGSGTLKISAGAANASVALDGAKKGNAPIEFNDIPAGKHGIQIFAKGFLPYVDTIKLDAGQTLSIQPKLAPLAGLEVKSIPPITKLSLDSSDVGSTPYSQTDMMPGNHWIKLSCDTYMDTACPISLESGKTSRILIKLMHTPEIQKKIDHQKSVRGWTFRYIAGGSAILAFAGGFLENSTAQDRYNDYRALNTVGDHSSD
jgi:hypothetical protein